MPPSRWIGFALVWLALAIFTFDALKNRRKQALAPVS
jgi:chloramphenicol-sensitive protein RarD